MKAVVKADLKLRLVGMYQRGGMQQIQKFIEDNGQSDYLKRHRQHKATLQGVEILCKEIIDGRDVF